ncbi:MAG: glycosyltransferase family 39 protein [Chloroflexi bacterium]|nr:glycosyltransferase family 39 protein [Chloroflexota bacterium]
MQQRIQDLVQSLRRRLERMLVAPSLLELVARWRRLRRQVEDYFRDPEHQLFAAIVLAALLLRVSYLDLIPFGRLQVEQLDAALQIVAALRFPLAGSSNTAGAVQPPLMAYVLTLPLLFGRDPRIAATFLALLNVAAIVDLYSLARRHYGLRVAALSAGLLSVAPWSVLAARNIAPMALFLPIGIFWLHALFIALVEHKPWGWVASCVLLALLLYLSFAAIPLLVLFGALILLYPRRVRWLEVMVGISMGGVLFLPYLYYENLRRFADLRLILTEMAHNARLLELHVANLRAALWAHSGQGLEGLMRPASEPFGLGQGAFFWLSRLQGWLFVLAIPTVSALALLAWARWRERQDSYKYVVLAIWLWLPLLAPFLFATTFDQAGPTPESLASIYPAGFLALGITLDRLLRLLERSIIARRWWGPFLRLLTLLFCFALVAWGGYEVTYLVGYVGHNDVTAGYGVPYRFWRRTANLVRREVLAAPTDQVWVYAEGWDVERDEQPMVLNYLLAPRVRAIFFRGGTIGGQAGDTAPAMFLPAARPGLYLFLRPEPLVEESLRQLGGQSVGEVLFPDERTAHLQFVAARTVDEALESIQVRGLWALDSGLRLVGYDWPPRALPGTSAPLITYWTFVNVPSDVYENEQRIFAYLSDPEGNLKAQCSGSGLPERYWEPGYLLKQWCLLAVPAELPAGDYYALVGLERLVDGNRSLYIDDQGHPLGEAIPLGPLSVGR